LSNYQPEERNFKREQVGTLTGVVSSIYHRKEAEKNLDSMVSLFKKVDLKFNDPILCVERYEFEDNKWIAKPIQPPTMEPTSIDCITLNTWFSKHYQLERTNKLLQLIQSKRPDIICLQEVTIPTLQMILENVFIRSHYATSTIKIPQGYECVMLTNRKFSVIHFTRKLPTEMSRRVILGCIFFTGGKSMIVGTSHLESLRNPRIRQTQLDIILSLLENIPIDVIPNQYHNYSFKFEDRIFMGDCNFDPSRSVCIEESIVEKCKFNDMWVDLHPGVDGFTMPPKKRNKGNRIDRVLYKIMNWTPKSINLIGTEDIDTNCNECRSSKGACTISDHYGLLTTLHYENQ